MPTSLSPSGTPTVPSTLSIPLDSETADVASITPALQGLLDGVHANDLGASKVFSAFQTLSFIPGAPPLTLTSLYTAVFSATLTPVAGAFTADDRPIFVGMLNVASTAANTVFEIQGQYTDGVTPVTFTQTYQQFVPDATVATVPFLFCATSGGTVTGDTSISCIVRARVASGAGNIPAGGGMLIAGMSRDLS